MSRTHYVLGFAFTEDLSDVLLIEKARPAWQAGKLNGIGGHVEKQEAPCDAMQREFCEETGLITSGTEWSWFATMQGSDWVVACYFGTFPRPFLRGWRKTTDEQPRLISMDVVPRDASILPNVCWLLPMAIQHVRNPHESILEIKYP